MRIKRGTGHKRHQLFNRAFGKLGSVALLATGTREPGPEKHAPLRLVESHGIAQLAVQGLRHDTGAFKVGFAHHRHSRVQPIEC